MSQGAEDRRQGYIGVKLMSLLALEILSIFYTIAALLL